jgi:hypothetical protein
MTRVRIIHFGVVFLDAYWIEMFNPFINLPKVKLVIIEVQH